ncbi:MAG: hypothetical protein ACYTBJ_16505 [Planctomycetota bacterium]|jgi:hypothetical protein
MKRSPFAAVVCLILAVCFTFIIAAVITSRKGLLAKRLDRILSFEKQQLDTCTLGPAMLCAKTTTLEGAEASVFAARFAENLRENCLRMYKNRRVSDPFTYQVSFKTGDSTWTFLIALQPTKTSINCDTQPPSTHGGLMILDKKAGPQLDSLIKSLLPDEVEPTPAREQITTGPPAAL